MNKKEFNKIMIDLGINSDNITNIEVSKNFLKHF